MKASAYNRYEDIKWLYEVPELKEALMQAGGDVVFSYEDRPVILSNTDNGPRDIAITRATIDMDGQVILYGYDNDCDSFGRFSCDDFEYGHLDFVRSAILQSSRQKELHK